MSSDRFASLNQEELAQIVENKQSANTKSATKYAVRIFRDYLEAKNLPVDFESFETTELDARLKMFYGELRTTKGELYKQTSLKAVRDGLARFMKDKLSLDIVRGAEFSNSIQMFSAMCKQTYAKGKGGVDHKSPIAEADIDKMYSSVTFNTDTPCGLLNKVWFELCLYFCRRGRENQRELKASMFTVRRDADNNEYVCQTDTEVTKNHRGTISDNDKTVRMYATGTKSCPVSSFKKYLSKSNPKCKALFQTPRDSFQEEDNIWYENRPLGKNKLGSMMQNISKLAGSSQIYTNHCIRATAITALSHAGFEARHIMTVSGHRNESSVKSYVRDTTTTQKREMSATISRLVETNDDDQMDDGMDDVLTLSLSQTERMLQDISTYENVQNASERTVTQLPLPVDVQVDNQVKTIINSQTEYQIQNVTPTQTQSSAFNFHGCNVQIHNYYTK